MKTDLFLGLSLIAGMPLQASPSLMDVTVTLVMLLTEHPEVGN